MKNNKNIYLFFFFTFSIIAYVLYDKNNYYDEIETNKGVAIGKVIGYQFSKYEYFVKYEYEVNNVKYFNDVSTDFF